MLVIYPTATPGLTIRAGKHTLALFGCNHARARDRACTHGARDAARLRASACRVGIMALAPQGSLWSKGTRNPASCTCLEEIFFPKASSQDFTRDSRRRQGAETSVAKAHFCHFHIQAKGYLWAKGGTQGVKGTQRTAFLETPKNTLKHPPACPLPPPPPPLPPPAPPLPPSPAPLPAPHACQAWSSSGRAGTS